MNIFVAAGLMVAAAWVLARALPAQNAAMIQGCLILCEFALESMCRGRAWLGPGLIFWPALVVLARAGFRWLLRRRQWNYGLWLIFLSGIFIAATQFAWNGLAKLAAIRFAVTVVCLFFLSPWFISKFPQQPHDHAQ